MEGQREQMEFQDRGGRSWIVEVINRTGVGREPTVVRLIRSEDGDGLVLDATEFIKVTRFVNTGGHSLIIL